MKDDPDTKVGLRIETPGNLSHAIEGRIVFAPNNKVNKEEKAAADADDNKSAKRKNLNIEYL